MMGKQAQESRIVASHVGRKRIQVFEHQQIRIGDRINGQVFSERYYNTLARYAEKHQQRYYRLIHRGIRFLHYVGAIQVGNLTIEILPKAEDSGKPDSSQWQEVLIRMLRACRLLKVDTPGSAYLRLHSNSILDLYFALFLEELGLLLRRGLFKSYWPHSANLMVWKGQVQFSKQIQYNHSHQERCYTRYSDFNYNHLANRVLYEALLVLNQLSLAPALKEKLQTLLRQFPKVERLQVQESHFDQLLIDRKAAAYQKALEIARLLLFNFSPDVRAGRHHLLAILFDMNLLFEEYLYRQLQKLEGPDLRVHRQQYRPFWNRRYIRPDLLLEYKGQRYILDTKWKILKKTSPAMADLKQVFIYNQYFQTQHSVLIYPSANNLADLPPVPFQPSGEEAQTYYCQVKFVDVVRDSKLNPEIGQEILAVL